MALEITVYRGTRTRFFVTDTYTETVQIWTISLLVVVVVTLSLLRATSELNQIGLVAKNVKWYVWLCRYLGQRSGPDTELRIDIRRVRDFQQRRESVPLTQEFQFL
jgi:hypothetical protein